MCEMTVCRQCRVCAPLLCLQNSRDLPRSATKEGLRECTLASVLLQFTCRMLCDVHSLTVGNKYAFSLARQHFISQTVFCPHVVCHASYFVVLDFAVCSF